MAHDENSGEHLWQKIAARKQDVSGTIQGPGASGRNGASPAEELFLDALQLAVSAESDREIQPAGPEAARARLLAAIRKGNGPVPYAGPIKATRKPTLPWKSSRMHRGLLIALLTLVIGAAVGLLIQQYQSDACRYKQGETLPQTLPVPGNVPPVSGGEKSRSINTILPNANTPDKGMADATASQPGRVTGAPQSHCE